MMMSSKTKAVLTRRAWLQSLPDLEDDFPDVPLSGPDVWLGSEQLVVDAPLVLAHLSGLAMTTHVPDYSL